MRSLALLLFDVFGCLGCHHRRRPLPHGTFPHADAESVRRSLAARVRHRSGSQAYLPLTPVVAERGSSVYGGS